jgi:Flp pilus assembly protein TadG
MKTLNSHRNENGQILLILTIGIVALLGMVALAVDGGMIFADRRYSQNAADASAFAGAGAAALELENGNINSSNFNCTGAFKTGKVLNDKHKLYPAINSAIAAALHRASSNNFTLQYPLENQHGVEVNCVSSGGEYYLEVRTVVSTNVQTAFAHLFYDGQVHNTVEAVARVDLTYSPGGTGSLTHLNESCDKPLLFFLGKSSPAYIDGANSNGCIYDKGSANIVYSDSPLRTNIGCTGFHPQLPKYENGCPEEDEWYSDVIADGSYVPKVYLEELVLRKTNMSQAAIVSFWEGQCKATKEQGKKATYNGKGTFSIEPGRYQYIKVTSKDVVLNMKSGLYCIDEDFTATGGTVQSEAGGVTIILTSYPKEKGNLTGGSLGFSGNATFKLFPRTKTDHYDNLLIYAAKYNTNTQNILGSSSSYFEGTLWFPDGIAYLSGSGTEVSLGTQVIADQIQLGGSNDLKMVYDPTKIWTMPSSVSLVK